MDASGYLDCSQMNSEEIWLVKMPKYLATKLAKSSGSNIGKLVVKKSAIDSSKSAIDVQFHLDKSVVEKEEIPKDYVCSSIKSADQNVAVYSQCADNVCLEGPVYEKLELRPLRNDVDYMKLKKQEIIRASQPKRVVKQFDKVINNFKPVSDHDFNIQFKKMKKAQGPKLRGDKDKVTEILFGAFEKHQYYNIKDLIEITNQPITYLKEILKEICNYNLKNPHKNMWELKPEFRHYNYE